MKLVDLYVAEVGKHLPEKQRADIVNELRSSIEDALEDEGRAQGRPADEVLAAQVLKRMGPPEKTAASYLPPRYLIGPELYPKYLKVLGTVTSLVALVSAIAFGATLGASAQLRDHFANTLVQALSQLIGTILLGAAVVTLVFAVFELLSRRTLGEPEAWDPLKLKAELDPDRINPYELTFEMLASIVALVIFNLYPQWIGIYAVSGGQWQSAPVLGAGFFQYLPWLSLWWVLQVIVDLILLAQRRRQPLTRLGELGLELMRIGIFFAFVLGPGIIAIDPAALARLGYTLDPQALATANSGLNTAVRVGLGIGAAVSAVDLVRDVYRIYLRGRVTWAGLWGRN